MLLIFLDICEESEFFLLPFCYSECPKFFYASNETSPSSTSGNVGRRHAVCLRCHQTCVRCSGPADTECLNCSIHRRLTTDHQCIDIDSEGHHFSWLVIVAICTLPVAVIGILGVSVWLWLRQRRTSNRLLYRNLLSCISK